MTRPPKIKKQTSAGGVIFRCPDHAVEVVLVLIKGKKTWCLPKGVIDKNEDPPTTALREVREETGLTGELQDKIGKISYWYFLKHEMTKVNKSVYFYLMKYKEGSTDDHDHEVDEARWYPIDEAIHIMSYKSEREILQKAKTMISRSLEFRH